MQHIDGYYKKIGPFNYVNRVYPILLRILNRILNIILNRILNRMLNRLMRGYRLIQRLPRVPTLLTQNRNIFGRIAVRLR